MHLDDDKTCLPLPLRNSNLPWRPDDEDQAAAPRDGDGWSCILGHLRFRLDVYWDSVYRDYETPGAPPPSKNPPDFQLRLDNTVTEKELGYWTFPRLDIAVHVAQTLHQERLDALLTSVSKELHDVAA